MAEDAQPVIPGHSGFPVDIFLEDQIDDFICPICTDVCRDAVETSCTHIFCASCLQKALGLKAECPLDKRKLSPNDVRPAGFVRRKIINMMARCPNYTGGCEVKSVLRDLRAHITKCEYAMVECSNCKELLRLNEFDDHTENKCAWRVVECEYCNSQLPSIEVKEHLAKTCADYPIPCANNCGVDMRPRRQMIQHLENECVLQEIRCKYARHGCTARAPRQDMKDHMQNAAYHLELVETHFESELDGLRVEMTEMIRFMMQIGNEKKFTSFLNDIKADDPPESVRLIVRGMKIFSTNVVVQERCCLSLLTLCEVNNKNAEVNIRVVVQEGGIKQIIDAMGRHQDKVKIQEYALHVLRKMATSMEVKNYVQVHPYVDCVGQILRSMRIHCEDIAIQRDAIGVLLNMAVNDVIESRIGSQGGIQHIINAMNKYPDSPALIQLACHSLFHLTFDDDNKKRLMACGALPRLMQALQRHSRHTNIVYYSLRAMAQMAKNDTYRDNMRALGLAKLAAQALENHTAHKDLQKKVKILLQRLTEG